MSTEEIEEEEKIAEERLHAQLDELIRGTIRDIVGYRECVVSLASMNTVADAVRSMIRNRIGAVLVIDDDRLLGLFTERDVLTRVVAKGLDPEITRLESVMTASPEILLYDHEIVYALNSMTVGGYRHIPIVNEQGRPMSVLSMRDVMDHIVSFYSSEVFNLPPMPTPQVCLQREGA